MFYASIPVLLQILQVSLKKSKCAHVSQFYFIFSFFPKHILLLSSFMYIPNCWVDCKWSSWSNCSESCGVGTKTREIDVTAKQDSQNCTGNDTESCNDKECPGQSIINIIISFSSLWVTYFHICSVDCKWSPWSSCSKECGLGTRTREIDVMAKYDGQKCTGNDAESCKSKECPGKSIINTIISFLFLWVKYFLFFWLWITNYLFTFVQLIANGPSGLVVVRPVVKEPKQERLKYRQIMVA